MALDPAILVVRKLPPNAQFWSYQRGPAFVTEGGKIITLLSGSLVYCRPKSFSLGSYIVEPIQGYLVLDPNETAFPQPPQPICRGGTCSAEVVEQWFEPYNSSLPKLVEETYEDPVSRFSLIEYPKTYIIGETRWASGLGKIILGRLG